MKKMNRASDSCGKQAINICTIGITEERTEWKGQKKCEETVANNNLILNIHLE